MKRNVLMPVPEAKESSSSTRPGLFVLLFFFWTVLAQFARVSSSTLHRCWYISMEKTAIVTFFPKFYDVLNRCLVVIVYTATAHADTSWKLWTRARDRVPGREKGGVWQLEWLWGLINIGFSSHNTIVFKFVAPNRETSLSFRHKTSEDR